MSKILTERWCYDDGFYQYVLAGCIFLDNYRNSKYEA